MLLRGVLITAFNSAFKLYACIIPVRDFITFWFLSLTPETPILTIGRAHASRTLPR